MRLLSNSLLCRTAAIIINVTSCFCRHKGEGWDRGVGGGGRESWEGEEWEGEEERGEGGSYMGQQELQEPCTLQEFMPHQLDSNTPPPPGI